jgi:hypothetical protein
MMEGRTLIATAVLKLDFSKAIARSIRRDNAKKKENARSAMKVNLCLVTLENGSANPAGCLATMEQEEPQCHEC